MKTTKTTKKSTKAATKATNGKAAKVREEEAETEAAAKDRYGSRIGSLGAKLNKLLIKHKGERLTLAEIHEKSGVGRPRCQSHLAKMRELKFVVRNSEGYKLRTGKAAD